MTDSLLSIHKLTTQIGRDDGAIIPVSSVSFDIHPGETFALLGESGCGKSMTALSVMRLLPPAGKITEGEIFLDGINL
ncbi:peptide ABC transporter ATP-binding protein, partial [Solemya velum gill symbiont]